MEYQASIEFRQYKDDYQEGETDLISSWGIELSAPYREQLSEQILDTIGADQLSDLNDEQINEYNFAYEYSFDRYITGGEDTPTATQIELWKKGEIELYILRAHILVSICTPKPIKL